MHKIARVDKNQPDLVKQLRDLGAEVQHLHQLGGGAADLLVAYRGRWHVAEVKNPDQPPSKRKLTPDEREWHDHFNPFAPVFIWETIEDAVRDLQATN